MNNMNDTDNTSEYYIYPDGYEPANMTKKEKNVVPRQKKDIDVAVIVSIVIGGLIVVSALLSTIFCLSESDFHGMPIKAIYSGLLSLRGTRTINLIENLIYIITSSLLAGMIIGFMPLITALRRGYRRLGFTGWYLCIVGSLLLGIYLAVPLCIVFTAIALTRNNTSEIKKKPIFVILVSVIVIAAAIILGMAANENRELRGILYGTYIFLDADVIHFLVKVLWSATIPYLATSAVGALASGAVFGILPAVIASKRGKKKLALAGWLACVIGSFYFGLFAAIPLCCVFTIIPLLKKRS